MTPVLWFYDHGLGVFPLTGKQPACRSWDDYTCTREQAARFKNYGVRLGPSSFGLVGAIDTDDAPSEAWVRANVPVTPFSVTTGRGVHRYYRLSGPVPRFLHRDGLTIELKSAGQYLCGPGSTHPSGAIYTAADWSWNANDLPYFPSADFLFDDRTVAPGPSGGPFEFPAEVSRGERHAELFRLVRSFKGMGAERAMAREVVTLANTHRCVPPLVEDRAFERWFDRAWELADRPFTAIDPLAHVTLEPHTPIVDLDAVELEF